jgi:hypothetical protein
MSDLNDEDLALQEVQAAGLEPLDPATMGPSTWANSGLGVDLGLARGAAKAGRAIGVLAGGTVGRAMDAIANAGHRARGEAESTGFQDNTFQATDEYAGTAVDHWTPGPNEVGKAGQILGGLAEVAAPLAAGAGNPTLLMASAGTNTGADLVNQGVDSTTATVAAVTDTAATGFGFKIPFLGKGLVTRALTGAAGNLAVNAGATELTHANLQAGGYDELAAQYDPLDPTARAVDVLTGLGFGAIAHAGARPSDIDAALTARNAEHFQETAHPGTPADARSSMLAQTALSTAIEQALRGDKVDIASHIRAADFMLPDAVATQPIGEALGSIEGSPQHVAFESAVAGVFEREGGMVKDPADHGGATNFGISSRAHPGVDVANLTREDAKEIYRNEYWRKISADALPDNLRAMAFDAAVNQGVGWTKKALEQAGGDPAKFLELREARYREIVANDPTQAKFLRGWLNRLGTFREDNPAGRALRERLVGDPEKLATEYAALPESKGGIVLNTDVARELAPEYAADRTRSADVHEAASDVVKTLYDAKLAAPTPEGLDPTVLFTAGGTGAGKTTGVDLVGDAFGKPEIVYDTNMSTLHSAIDKIEQALASLRKVEILYVYRDPVEALTGGAIPRAQRMKARLGSGRTVPIDEHAKTHQGARQVMDALAEKYRDDPRVQLTAVDNSRGKGQAIITPLESIPAVPENGVREGLESQLEAARQAGLDEDLYRGFSAAGRGAAQPRSGGEARPGVRSEPQPQRGQVTDQPALQAAEHLAAEHPDALIATGFDEDGNPRYSSVADAKASIDAEHAKALADADAFEAAVNCHLRRGPDHAG